MPWTGSAPNQTYQRSDGVRSGSAVNQTAKTNGVNNTAALADARENDFATALSLCWKIDGGTQPTVNLPMNGKKLTGMAAGSASTDSIRLGQVQYGSLIYAAVSGTANAITLTLTPVSTGPIAGMTIVFIPASDSTSAVTIDEGNGAVALQYNGAALIGGELQAGQPARITYDGSHWQLESSARLADLNALAKTDSNIIVGDGTNWVAESGATARTSLGLGTGDSPQFTAVNIGNASDTTLSRASAGDLQIETNIIYRAGGTDVAIADGGTGASTAAAGFANLKQSASTSATGVVQLADQAAMEALTSGRAVTADVQHFHPGHPKAGGLMDGVTAQAFYSGDYGMGAVTHDATGEWTVAFDTAFASTSYWGAMTCEDNTTTQGKMMGWRKHSSGGTRTSSSIQFTCINSSGNNNDCDNIGMAFWGDYA
jgi:hypothetical protein